MDIALTKRMIKLDNGFNVHVTEAGCGPALVFLHGLAVSAQAYIELIEQLGWNYWVIAPDLPDHGQSDSLPWGHTVQDMADVVARMLEAMYVPEAIVVGHSMGGAVAVELAGRSSRVDSLILLDPATGEAHHEGIYAATRSKLPLRAAHFLAGAAIDIAGDAIRAGSLRRLSERLSLADRLRSSVSGLGVLRASYALMKHDTYHQLRFIREAGIPTTVLHGSEDRIVSAIAGMQTALATGGRLQLLPGRFHSWMISDPELAARKIQEAA